MPRRPPRVLAAALAVLLVLALSLWWASCRESTHLSPGLRLVPGASEWHIGSVDGLVGVVWARPGDRSHGRRRSHRVLGVRYHSFLIGGGYLPGGGYLHRVQHIWVPGWWPVTLLSLLNVVLLAREWQRRRHSPGTCRQCGYDLTANASGRCPECGAEVPPVAAEARA